MRLTSGNPFTTAISGRTSGATRLDGRRAAIDARTLMSDWCATVGSCDLLTWLPSVKARGAARF
jgi:hypothetical protein